MKIRHPEDLAEEVLGILVDKPYYAIVSALGKTMRDLPEREQKVIRARFWFPEIPTCLTLKQCGEMLGVSKSYAAQLEATALSRMRNPVRKRLLKSLLFGDEASGKTGELK